MTDYPLTLSAGHVHAARVDANGNGTSSLDANHVHRIVGWTVYPVNGHTHAFMAAQASAPGQKPCNCGRK